MNVWIFFSEVTVVLRVSAPYSRTDFIVVLKILILMLMVRLAVVKMFFICREAVITRFALLVLHHRLLPRLSSCYLGRWNSPLLQAHHHPVLPDVCWLRHYSWGPCSFPLWTFRQRRAELSTTELVFSCICFWVWDRRARARSSSWSLRSKESTEFRFSSGMRMSSIRPRDGDGGKSKSRKVGGPVAFCGPRWGLGALPLAGVRGFAPWSWKLFFFFFSKLKIWKYPSSNTVSCFKQPLIIHSLLCFKAFFQRNKPGFDKGFYPKTLYSWHKQQRLHT